MVAGFDPDAGRVEFIAGGAMAHRRDYAELLAGLERARGALEAIGISNFKLVFHSSAHYCQTCGAELRRYYGADGGALRDDDFVRELYEPPS